MKILLAITTYESRSFLGRLFRNIQNEIDPKPDYTLFVSTDYAPFNDLLFIERNFKLPHKIINMPFCKDATKILGNPYYTIAIVRQAALEYARKHKEFSHLLFLDDDVVVQTRNALELMTEHTSPYLIVGAPYLRVYPEGLYLACKWGTVNVGRYLLKKQAFYPFDYPIMISGGFMCINRKVIDDERINFYPFSEVHYKTGASEDYGYCLLSRQYGYYCILDGRIKLYHYFKETLKQKKPWMVDKQGGKYIEFSY
ncbi:MAG: hypothetical protein ACPLKS_04805 [Caldisericum exile]|uniref:hypothetical protein n=1 Tax=Caldisericum exile TaxID=693075 RepID=UPI003C755783